MSCADTPKSSHPPQPPEPGGSLQSKARVKVLPHCSVLGLASSPPLTLGTLLSLLYVKPVMLADEAQESGLGHHKPWSWGMAQR